MIFLKNTNFILKYNKNLLCTNSILLNKSKLKFPKFVPNIKLKIKEPIKHKKSLNEYFNIILKMSNLKKYQETFLLMTPSLWSIAMYNKNFDIATIDSIWIQFLHVFVLTNLLKCTLLPLSYMFDHVRDFGSDQNVTLAILNYL